ncbi:MAG: NAD(P)-dependent oxidoreductase [Akkermansiaceae bacterium]|jgi:3-hydroxyisobutyrate dehydrogenase/glyoxylate/succinic semialdehyde reductase|nr:NAD(P)-dependent oxidoreductase [Akkermansiaceae bacterium]
MKVAVLGLGIIGSRVAARLAADPECEVRTWNRSPKPGVPGFCQDPAEAAAGADQVSLYLKDSAAVREVASRLPAGPLRVLNHSTIDLATTRWLGEHGRRMGWTVLDCPFTGSREASAAGQLVYYAAGDAAEIDAITPFLLKSGRKLIPCGEFGNATIIKLVTNLVSACTVQALCEGMATAIHQGIPAAAFREAIADNACTSPLATMKLPTMAAGDFSTHFSLGNMLKDSRYVLDLASGIDTPAILAVSARMADLCERGLADLDYSALFSPYLNHD